MELQQRNRVLSAAVAAAWGLSITALAPAAHAAEWSDTEFQFLYGTNFHQPFIPGDVTKSIITLQNASGFKYGRSFFFVDFLRSNAAGNNAGEVYGEWYPTFSLSKMTGQKVSAGIIKDVGITLGLNYGADNGGPNPRVFLPGITLDFDVPGFVFFNVDFLAFIDHGNFKIPNGPTVAACGGYASTYQITPSWFAPFEIAGQKFEFSGFWDFIGSHGTCVSQNLTQTQLRWDVGANFGAPKTAYIGVEYQYWHNKYGFQGVQDNLPQFLFVWKF